MASVPDLSVFTMLTNCDMLQPTLLAASTLQHTFGVKLTCLCHCLPIHITTNPSFSLNGCYWNAVANSV